jgi:hypothetical protein
MELRSRPDDTGVVAAAAVPGDVELAAGKERGTRAGPTGEAENGVTIPVAGVVADEGVWLAGVDVI